MNLIDKYSVSFIGERRDYELYQDKIIFSLYEYGTKRAEYIIFLKDLDPIYNKMWLKNKKYEIAVGVLFVSTFIVPGLIIGIVQRVNNVPIAYHDLITDFLIFYYWPIIILVILLLAKSIIRPWLNEHIVFNYKSGVAAISVEKIKKHSKEFDVFISNMVHYTNQNVTY